MYAVHTHVRSMINWIIVIFLKFVVISFLRVCYFRAQGYESELIGPSDIEQLIPWVRVDDVEGGMFIPGDGLTDATNTAMALAKGAVANGKI